MGTELGGEAEPRHLSSRVWGPATAAARDAALAARRGASGDSRQGLPFWLFKGETDRVPLMGYRCRCRGRCKRYRYLFGL